MVLPWLSSRAVKTTWGREKTAISKNTNSSRQQQHNQRLILLTHLIIHQTPVYIQIKDSGELLNRLLCTSLHCYFTTLILFCLNISVFFTHPITVSANKHIITFCSALPVLVFTMNKKLLFLHLTATCLFVTNTQQRLLLRPSDI